MKGLTETDESAPIKDAAVITWLKDHAVLLQSIDPRSSTKDLDFLDGIIGQARIVGIGEATHGNKEFTLVRHKMLRFMAEEMGFNGLILETPVEEAKDVDLYIKTGKGNPRDLINNMPYWVHATAEVLATIEWMKNYNKGHPDKQITFKGCDIPVDDKRRQQNMSVRDKAMADNCIAILDESGDDSKFVLWSHNTHVSYTDSPQMTSQGHFLRQQLHEEYVNFATLFNEGEFNAVPWNEEKRQYSGKIQLFHLDKAPKETYEHFFAQTGLPFSITDIRPTKTNDVFERWEKQGTYKVREVGSSFNPKEADSFFPFVDLNNKYDGVVWIDKISPSTLLS